MDEVTAQVTLVTGTYLARLAIALAVAFLTLQYLGVWAVAQASTAFAIALAAWPIAGVAAICLVTTIVLVTVGLRRYLGRGILPPSWHLTLAAVLDVLWCVLGYVLSGSSAMPFPPLLVLVIGVHGVLLSASAVGGVTILASALFMVVTLAWSDIHDATFSTATQAALFVAVGMVSAVVGNRLRAAAWTVRRLSTTVAQLTDGHDDLIERLPVGVVVVDVDGRATLANAYVGRLLGCAADSALSPDTLYNHLTTHLPDLAQAVGTIMVTPTDGAPVGNHTGEGALPGMTSPTSFRWCAWEVVARDVPDLDRLENSALAATPRHGMPARADAPTPPLRRQAVVTLVDVTPRRDAAAMRARAERFAAVAELSAGLAHEVRNPIAALRSSAEQLADSARGQGAWDAADQRLLEIVVREADRLNSLVTEFLEFARVGGGAPGVHALERIVRDAVALAARSISADTHVQFVTDLEPIELMTDADLVFRVLSNLLLNAAQFSPEGGTVTVTARQTPQRDRLIITVRDHGPGVAPELRERVFSPFFTTRAIGSGLGLAIAARSAALLAGQLTCDAPDDGRGAQFTLVLPLTTTSATAPAATVSPPLPPVCLPA